MKRETVEKILAARKIKAKGGTYSIPDKEVVTLLAGRGRMSGISGVISLELGDGYLVGKTKKGAETYLEYEIVRAISFERKDVTDRAAGFV